MSSDGKSFAENWTFPTELKKELGASSYTITPLPPHEVFRSGRPKFEALFLDRGGKVLSRRLAMELVSKKTGKPYHVVSRVEPQRSSPPKIILRPSEPSASAVSTLEDVLQDTSQ